MPTCFTVFKRIALALGAAATSAAGGLAWAQNPAAPGAAAQIAQARASGSAASLSLTSAITPATPHLGRPMHAWVLASVPALGNATFARTAAGQWVPFDAAGGSIPPSAMVGTASPSATDLALAVRDDTRGLNGTRFWVGYGVADAAGGAASAWADMLRNQRYESVHTLGQITAPWPLVPATAQTLRDALQAGLLRDSRPIAFGPPDCAFCMVGGVTTATAAPGAPTPAQRTPNFSGTTLQEAAVDEADLIKSNGRVVFSLSGAYGNPVGSRGDASGMLLRRNGLNEATPNRLNDGDALTLPWSDGFRGQGLFWDGERNQVIALASPSSGWAGYDRWFAPSAWVGGATEVLWVAAADAQALQVTRRLKVDGHLIASRRLGSTLVLVLRHSPPLASAPVASRPILAANFMPTVSLDGAAAQALLSPEQCLLQPDNANATGSLITVVAVDLAAPRSASLQQQLGARCFAGGTEAFYMSERALVLATTRQGYTVGTDGLVQYPARTSTDLHQFTLDGLNIGYAGSGNALGHLGFDQNRKPWRISEFDGHLRVITQTEPSFGRWFGPPVILPAALTPPGAPAVAAPQQTLPPAPDVDSPGRLTIFRPQGGELVQVSTLPNAQRPAALGKPGEQLYASRFTGARGYLVTYRLIDPLYVLDLANPADPKITGELEVAGYSDYLFPLSDKLLLGVGKDAIADSSVGDGRMAWYQGVKLSLIDVTDPARPTEVAKQVIGQRGTDAGVLRDHHAIALQWVGGTSTVAPSRVRIALPLSLHEQFSAGAREPSQWATFSTNQLRRFEVDLGAKTLADRSPVAPSVPSQRATDRDRALLWQEQSHWYQDGRWVSAPW